MVKTRIIVHIEGDHPEKVTIRGEGTPDLNWEKGVELTPHAHEEWIWETETPFSNGEFKILINDQEMELGHNHPLYPGASIRVNPKFPN